MPEKTETSTSISDRTVLDYIRRTGSCTILDLVEFTGVTATAIRQRLNRLMDQQLVVREAETVGRGRPTHRYSLSAAGVRSVGDNYRDLAWVLWSELRAIEDPDIRHGLLSRVVSRLGDIYRSQIQGEDYSERVAALQNMMEARDIPFEIEQPEDTNQLPVLKAWACPYPDLAEHDRSICSMEKMLFSEILGQKIRLGDCRLDGALGCTFETGSPPAASI